MRAIQKDFFDEATGTGSEDNPARTSTSYTLACGRNILGEISNQRGSRKRTRGESAASNKMARRTRMSPASGWASKISPNTLSPATRRGPEGIAPDSSRSSRTPRSLEFPMRRARSQQIASNRDAFLSPVSAWILSKAGRRGAVEERTGGRGDPDRRATRTVSAWTAPSRTARARRRARRGPDRNQGIRVMALTFACRAGDQGRFTVKERAKPAARKTSGGVDSG